jgi:hypothetical protein
MTAMLKTKQPMSPFRLFPVPLLLSVFSVHSVGEPAGPITQTRDGRLQLITSGNHYVFNLAWLKQLPPAPDHE